MSAIGAWLEDLGLGQYADAFERNAVELEVLPDQTDEDLRNFGVNAAGDRVRLRMAIAAVSEPAELEESAGGSSSSDRASAKEAMPEAKRRQITVLFADVVGYTPLAEKLGDAKALLDAVG